MSNQSGDSRVVQTRKEDPQLEIKRYAVLIGITLIPTLRYFHVNRKELIAMIANRKSSYYDPKAGGTFSYGYTHHMKEFVMRAGFGSLIGFGAQSFMYGPWLVKLDQDALEALEDEESLKYAVYQRQQNKDFKLPGKIED